MTFPLGKPVLVMAIVALGCGAAVASRREAPAKDLTVWVFAERQRLAYEPLVRQFERDTGLSVALRLVQESAMNRNLQSIFANDLRGAGVPDVVEVEINRLGKFFRPPVAEIGFEPLDPWLDQSGLRGQILASRLSPYTRRGVCFGLPNDVHPVGILYRDDLFREAGVDLAAAATWPEFHDACLRFQSYWRARGFAHRHAVELHAGKVDDLLVLLLQRGVNLIDDYDRVHMDDPRAAATLAFYAQCVAGPRSIAGESSGGEGPLVRDLIAGNLCAFVCPDWRIDMLKEAGGEAVRGKLRLMPLPRFDAADPPTATYGGTMGAILRASPRKADAWRLLRFLYFSPEALAARREAHLLPPVPAAWADPSYDAPDPDLGGQRVDALLVRLAAQIPPRYVSPATTVAGLSLAEVLWKATRHVNEHGDAGLEAACQAWLTDAAGELRRKTAQMSFEDVGGAAGREAPRP